MSYVAVPARRHALGLPAGSIRAAHVLGVVGLICAIILVPAKSGIAPIPPYLIYLLFMMVGHYFAAHGVSIATRNDPSPSPLYLPGGMVRLLIILALGGSIGWKLYQDEAGLMSQFDATVHAMKEQPLLPLVILGAFFLGVIVRAIIGRNNPSAAWQDFEAWVSLLAMIGLVIGGVIHLVINPTLMHSYIDPEWEGYVGGIIAFYFGERS